MLAVPWIAIFLATPMTWSSAWRWLCLTLLAAGYGAALANGQLGAPAVLPIAGLLFAAWAVSPQRKVYLRYVGHALFVVLAVALSLHGLPGFHNPRVIGPERITADAVPFTMYLNLDKPLTAFWLLLALPWVRPAHTLRTTLKAGVGGMLLTTLVCLLVALLTGLVRWEPKLPAASWLWMLNNLLLVTFAEEALFRGYVQGGLSRLLERLPYGQLLAIGIAAGLFGLAHIAGGWQWVLLGSIAGIGYGLTFRSGGLQAAMLAHFGLNVAHFFLFTYPMLESGTAR
jgi:uncharacterized protein